MIILIMCKISVLVPVYGVEKFIEKCCISLFNNTIAQDCEFIFVNDCSKDKSIEILNSIISKYPNLNIKIINHDKNKGLASARNTGIANASSEYVCFVDSDDWVELDYFETAYNTAKEQDADIVTFGYFSEGRKACKKYFHKFPDDLENIYSYFLVDKVRGYVWNKFYKKSLFTDNNILWADGINMWEDIYINSRILLKAKKFYSIDKCLYHYRTTNTTSIVHTKNPNKFNNVIFVLHSIETLLKENNLYEKFKKELFYKTVSFKMSIFRNLLMSKTQINKLFSSSDFNFLKNNIKMYPSFSKRFFVFFFSKKMINFCIFLNKIELLLRRSKNPKMTDEFFSQINIEDFPIINN